MGVIERKHRMHEEPGDEDRREGERKFERAVRTMVLVERRELRHDGEHHRHRGEHGENEEDRSAFILKIPGSTRSRSMTRSTIRRSGRG